LDEITRHPEINGAIIYDHLLETYRDFSPSKRTVRLYVCNLRETEGIPAPVKIRQYSEVEELPFGFQGQVDLGQKVMKDANGKNVRVYVFAMVLSCSRYKFVCFQVDPFTAQTFCEAHDRAFKYFGGRPTELVYDQDRVMVVSENSGDIIFTEAFENYKNYAGFSVHLCRGYDPESKGKVEAVVKYVKCNFLSCRVFHGIAALNSAGLAWLDRTGNGQIHETTKMVPKVVFAKEQRGDVQAESLLYAKRHILSGT
jgi:transposase